MNWIKAFFRKPEFPAFPFFDSSLRSVRVEGSIVYCVIRDYLDNDKVFTFRGASLEIVEDELPQPVASAQHSDVPPLHLLELFDDGNKCVLKVSYEALSTG